MDRESEKFIEEAAAYLENPSFLIRVANRLGEPIESLQKLLPENVSQAVTKATRLALEKALTVAIGSLEGKQVGLPLFRPIPLSAKTSARMHTAIAAATGAVGGVFGLLALPVELPATTVLMMRSIADRARRAGFELKDPAIQLECLYVFTLGSRSKDDDAAETAYYASRLGLAQMIRSGAGFLASHSAKEIFSGLEKGTAEVLVRFLGSVAAKFETSVSQKMLVQAAPIVGAVGGAAINALFADHFSSAAGFHFGLKRLEGLHGEAVVRECYHQAAKAARARSQAGESRKS